MRPFNPTHHPPTNQPLRTHQPRFLPLFYQVCLLRTARPLLWAFQCAIELSIAVLRRPDNGRACGSYGKGLEVRYHVQPRRLALGSGVLGAGGGMHHHRRPARWAAG